MQITQESVVKTVLSVTIQARITNKQSKMLQFTIKACAMVRHSKTVLR